MSFVIFIKDLVKFRIWCISISCTSLLSHLDTTIRHKCSLQWFISLKTNNLLQVFHILINVSRAISCQSCYNLCLHVKNAAFSTLFFLQFL